MREFLRRVPMLLLTSAALATASCGARKAPYEGKSVDALESMANSSDRTKQVQGVYGLGLKGAEASAAVPTLIERLRDPDALIRQNAALALGGIGPDAKEAVPELTRMLKDPDWRLRRQSAMALGGIGSDARESVKPLQKLKRDLPVVRRAADEALARIDPVKFASKAR